MLPAVADEQQDKAPVKVFILSGQSNMTGRGALGELDKPAEEQAATLAKFIKQPENLDKYKFLYDGPIKNDKGWTLRDDVYISLGEWPRNKEGEDGYSPWAKHGQFGPNYGGRRNNGFGPELAIGHMLGEYYDETVVLIKIAYGGNSLAGNFRPPSAGGTLGDKYPKVVETVNTALNNLGQFVPGYTNEQGYEIVGLFWNQGLSDVLPPAIDEYKDNLVYLINDWRKAFKAPKMLVSIGVTGNWGREFTELKENEKISDEDRAAYINGMKKLAEAQLSIPRMKAFHRNVKTAETRDFWRPREEHGGRGTETHWMANGESYWLIGEAMGQAMLELIKDQ
jgi:alpha-galactosidase